MVSNGREAEDDDEEGHGDPPEAKELLQVMIDDYDGKSISRWWAWMLVPVPDQTLPAIHRNSGKEAGCMGRVGA